MIRFSASNVQLQASPWLRTKLCKTPNAVRSPSLSTYSTTPSSGGVLAKPATSVRKRPISTSGLGPGCSRRYNFMAIRLARFSEELLCSPPMRLTSAADTGGSSASPRGGGEDDLGAGVRTEHLVAAHGIEHGRAEARTRVGIVENAGGGRPPQLCDGIADDRLVIAVRLGSERREVQLARLPGQMHVEQRKDEAAAFAPSRRTAKSLTETAWSEVPLAANQRRAAKNFGATVCSKAMSSRPANTVSSLPVTTSVKSSGAGIGPKRCWASCASSVNQKKP